MINLSKYIFKLYSTKHKEKCKKSYVSRQNSENTILQQTFFSTLRSTHFTAVPLCCCRFTLLHHNCVKKNIFHIWIFYPATYDNSNNNNKDFFFLSDYITFADSDARFCSLLWTLEWPPTTACFPGLCVSYLCICVCLSASIFLYVSLSIYLSIYISICLPG